MSPDDGFERILFADNMLNIPRVADAANGGIREASNAAVAGAGDSALRWDHWNGDMGDDIPIRGEDNTAWAHKKIKTDLLAALAEDAVHADHDDHPVDPGRAQGPLPLHLTSPWFVATGHYYPKATVQFLQAHGMATDDQITFFADPFPDQAGIVHR